MGWGRTGGGKRGRWGRPAGASAGTEAEAVRRRGYTRTMQQCSRACVRVWGRGGAGGSPRQNCAHSMNVSRQQQPGRQASYTALQGKAEPQQQLYYGMLYMACVCAMCLCVCIGPLMQLLLQQLQLSAALPCFSAAALRQTGTRGKPSAHAVPTGQGPTGPAETKPPLSGHGINHEGMKCSVQCA